MVLVDLAVFARVGNSNNNIVEQQMRVCIVHPHTVKPYHT